jgi:hypothetical protein
MGNINTSAYGKLIELKWPREDCLFTCFYSKNDSSDPLIAAFWNPQQSQLIESMLITSKFQTIDVSPTGTDIAIGNKDSLQIYQLGSSKVKNINESHDFFEWDPDGKKIFFKQFYGKGTAFNFDLYDLNRDRIILFDKDKHFVWNASGSSAIIVDEFDPTQEKANLQALNLWEDNGKDPIQLPITYSKFVVWGNNNQDVFVFSTNIVTIFHVIKQPNLPRIETLFLDDKSEIRDVKFVPNNTKVQILFENGNLGLWNLAKKSWEYGFRIDNIPKSNNTLFWIECLRGFILIENPDNFNNRGIVKILKPSGNNSVLDWSQAEPILKNSTKIQKWILNPNHTAIAIYDESDEISIINLSKL